MAHWFALDPALDGAALDLEEALTLTLNGKHIGKLGLRMSYVGSAGWARGSRGGAG